jgi:hypothetical protein
MRSVIIGTFLGVAIGIAYPLGGAAGPAKDCEAYAWPYYPPSCLSRADGDATELHRLAKPNSPGNSDAGLKSLGIAVEKSPVHPDIATTEPGSSRDAEQPPKVTIWRHGKPTTYVFQPG